jgi:hypothetical protein
VRLRALAFLVALAAALPALAETYVNVRFGTSVEFPAELFSQPQPPADNGDGQTWKAADGAELRVFGGYNVLDQKPAAFFADIVDNRKRYTTLTYSRIEDRWAVVSGFAGDLVYYEKFLFGADDEIVHTLMLSYPKTLKSRYDPLVGPIANSLSGP